MPPEGSWTRTTVAFAPRYSHPCNTPVGFAAWGHGSGEVSLAGYYGGEMAPSSFRRATGSSRREVTPSFANTLCRWYSTVRALMKS